MRVILSFIAIVLLCTSVSFGASPPASSDQSVLERNFDTLIEPNDLRDWIGLVARPSHKSPSRHSGLLGIGDHGDDRSKGPDFVLTRNLDPG